MESIRRESKSKMVFLERDTRSLVQTSIDFIGTHTYTTLPFASTTTTVVNSKGSSIFKWPRPLAAHPFGREEKGLLLEEREPFSTTPKGWDFFSSFAYSKSAGISELGREC